MAMAGDDEVRTLVIGGGLIGRAFAREVGAHILQDVPWHDVQQAREYLTEKVDRWVAPPGKWAIAWCAGSGVVGTDEATLAVETSYLESVLKVDLNLADGGRFMFVSSGGGLYGHGTLDCITEHTRPWPISPYGMAKLQQEKMVAEWAWRWKVPTTLIRPSNVYGYGQNLSKPQGLISRVFWCLHSGEPFALSVPEYTERDYIFVEDCARAMGRWLGTATTARPFRIDVALIASGQTATIREVIDIAEDITGKELRVEHGERNYAQPPRLAFCPGAGSAQTTSLRQGMISTWNHIRHLDPKAMPQ